MSKTPEEMAAEFSKFDSATDIGTDLGSYRQGLFEGFLAGYKAAQVELLQTISELEAQIDNLERVHGDRRE
jgi:hypothetical protein